MILMVIGQSMRRFYWASVYSWFRSSPHRKKLKHIFLLLIKILERIFCSLPCWRAYFILSPLISFGFYCWHVLVFLLSDMPLKSVHFISWSSLLCTHGSG